MCAQAVRTIERGGLIGGCGKRVSLHQKRQCGCKMQKVEECRQSTGWILC